MTSFHKTLALKVILLVLCVTLLNPCIYSGLGDYLNTIGRQEVAYSTTLPAKRATVYCLDGAYYARVPVRFNPVGHRALFAPTPFPFRSWRHPLVEEDRHPHRQLFSSEAEFNEYYSRAEHADFHSACYMIRIEDESVQQLGLPRKTPSPHSLMVFKESEFDFERATAYHLPNLPNPQTIVVSSLFYPPSEQLQEYTQRRAPLNYIMTPVVYSTAIAIDIPLSLILTLGVYCYDGIGSLVD